jgi:hypothetical protein
VENGGRRRRRAVGPPAGRAGQGPISRGIPQSIPPPARGQPTDLATDSGRRDRDIPAEHRRNSAPDPRIDTGCSRAADRSRPSCTGTGGGPVEAEAAKEDPLAPAGGGCCCAHAHRGRPLGHEQALPGPAAKSKMRNFYSGLDRWEINGRLRLLGNNCTSIGGRSATMPGHPRNELTGW